MTQTEFLEEEKKLLDNVKPIVDSTSVPSDWPEYEFKNLLAFYLAFKGTDSIDPRNISYEGYKEATGYWKNKGNMGNLITHTEEYKNSPYKIGDKVHIVHKIEHDWEYGVKETNIKEFDSIITDATMLYSTDGTKTVLGFMVKVPQGTFIFVGLDSIKYKIEK